MPDISQFSNKFNFGCLSARASEIKMKGSNVFLISVLCPLWFTLAAVAQEPSYSADSLVAAFANGSKTSLKGTEITFTDVVVESKKSRVIFKSSGNDKVICELVSPADNGRVAVLAGGRLTVAGRVRGRGALGNVTLDQCNLVLSDGTSVSSNAVSESPATAEVLPEQFEEEQLEEPIEMPLVTDDAGPVTPVGAAVSGRRLPAGSVPAPRPATRTVSGGTPVPQGPEQPSNVTGEASNTKADPSYTFYAFVAGLIGLALLAYVILRPALMPPRLETFPNSSSTPEMRRVALEALLSKQAKKK